MTRRILIANLAVLVRVQLIILSDQTKIHVLNALKPFQEDQWHENSWYKLCVSFKFFLLIRQKVHLRCLSGFRILPLPPPCIFSHSSAMRQKCCRGLLSPCITCFQAMLSFVIKFDPTIFAIIRLGMNDGLHFGQINS